MKFYVPVSSVRVDAKAKSSIMKIVPEPGHAVGEERGVPFEFLIRVATSLDMPAIVKIDVIVARCEKTIRGHGVGRSCEQRLVQIALEACPVIEAHGWSRGDAGILNRGKCC